MTTETRVSDVRRAQLIECLANAFLEEACGDPQIHILESEAERLAVLAVDELIPLRSASPQEGEIERVAEEAERALRITVWNFLRERGAKQDACYPIIEGAATSFRAALAAIPQSDEVTRLREASDLLRRAEMELRDSAKAAFNRQSPLTGNARLALADEIAAALSTNGASNV